MTLILQAKIAGNRGLCGCTYNHIATIHDEYGIALLAELVRTCEYHDANPADEIDGWKLINC